MEFNTGYLIPVLLVLCCSCAQCVQKLGKGCPDATSTVGMKANKDAKAGKLRRAAKNMWITWSISESQRAMKWEEGKRDGQRGRQRESEREIQR